MTKNSDTDTVYVVCFASDSELESPQAFYLTEEEAREAADAYLGIDGESGYVFEVKLGKPHVVTWYARIFKGLNSPINSTSTWFEADFGAGVRPVMAEVCEDAVYIVATGSGTTEEEAITDSNRRLDEYLKENK